ncbi:inovirus Gp2 family protein [Vibrio gigantis]|uniref:Inovirus Gp2 family protein n=1 Tax=Vibrio gigantis TaxID=296199 RepID=A0A5M9NFE3_9VIBR|nr:inovirus Gp2 family protein [Vibrio gigantis]KAA8667551.1 inovirus Gp2 family protein [Vibrio gigantis]
MSNNTYLPNITHSKTFNDYPVFFSDKGLYESALTSMTEVFEQAMDEFDAALATRLDLFLPEDHQDTDLSIINDYFALLKEKLETDSVFYVWRKRADKSPSHNYQAILLLDYNQYFGSAICWDKRNQLANHLKEAWQEAVQSHYEGKERSLVLFNDRGNYGLGTRCKSKSSVVKNSVFHRMSRLAEAWEEEHYCFGSSED